MVVSTEDGQRFGEAVEASQLGRRRLFGASNDNDLSSYLADPGTLVVTHQRHTLPTLGFTLVSHEPLPPWWKQGK